MIKRKAQVGQNCQDNKCQRSSQSTIIIHFGVAANEYSNVVGERFWRDYSFVFHPHSYEISWLGNVHIGIIHVCVSTQMHNLPVLEMAFSFLVMAREEVVAQQLLMVNLSYLIMDGWCCYATISW